MNDKNKEFLTPLHLAVDKSHYDVIDVLLKCRAKVNALDSAGQTALHRAARDGNVQACRMLLAAGADATIVSLQGATAAQLSTESVSKLLSEEPSSQAGADLEYQLLEAAKAGDLELVKKVVVEHPQIGTVTLIYRVPSPSLKIRCKYDNKPEMTFSHLKREHIKYVWSSMNNYHYQHTFHMR